MNLTYIPLHLDMVPLSVFGFSVALVACVAGLFSAHYRENWLQHIGMIFVGLASALKIEQTIERGHASAETALLAVGVAIFSAGVAWKVLVHQREDALRRKYERSKKAKAGR